MKVSSSLMAFSLDVGVELGVLLLLVPVQCLKCFPSGKYSLLCCGHLILFFEEDLVIDDILHNVEDDYLIL